MATFDKGAGDFAAAMAAVAAALLGKPNLQTAASKDELRYGTNGSLSIDLAMGRFYDHETNAGGGVLDLISRQIGCDHRGAVDWMRSHGLLDTPRNGKEPPPLGRPVAQYDYLDEAGDFLFQVVRFEPKTFRQRCRDETGAWSWRVKGVRQVPYRLPDLVEAVAMERTVYIVEGEKDVERLRSIGLTATCNAGGVGKWRAELNEFLRGADVVVLPDHDPVGQDHALDVAKHLQGVAAHVRVLDLGQHWPEMPKKGDVSDWIEGGGTADAMQAMVERAADWTPAPQPHVSKFGSLRWEDIGTSAVGYTWFIEDIIPMGEISLVFGDTGSGKSFNMFDMAMAAARGINWNGRNVERGLVVYVAAEAGKGFAKRKIAYALQHKLEPSDPLPFVLCTKRPDFFHDDSDALALIEEIKAIARMYDLPLVCIVIDTLSALAPGMNENASQDVSMVRKRLVMMQEAFNAAIVLVHHKPKNGTTPRGHGSLTADFETTVEFETLTDKRTDTGKTIHKATVRKQRESKSGASWEFTLPVVDVGQNKWGNPETSCAVEPYISGGRKPESIGFHATPTEMLFMRALYDSVLDHPLPPPAGLPKSISHAVNSRHVRALMRERSIPAHEDNAASDNKFRAAFKRAGDKLRDGGVIGVQGELFWATGKIVLGMS